MRSIKSPLVSLPIERVWQYVAYVQGVIIFRRRVLSILLYHIHLFFIKNLQRLNNNVSSNHNIIIFKYVNKNFQFEKDQI